MFLICYLTIELITIFALTGCCRIVFFLWFSFCVSFTVTFLLPLYFLCCSLLVFLLCWLTVWHTDIWDGAEYLMKAVIHYRIWLIKHVCNALFSYVLSYCVGVSSVIGLNAVRGPLCRWSLSKVQPKSTLVDQILIRHRMAVWKLSLVCTSLLKRA